MARLSIQGRGGPDIEEEHVFTMPWCGRNGSGEAGEECW